MAISIEKIEELKKRAHISYEEAKLILEKYDGDLVEALIELEKSNKTKKESSTKEEKLSKLRRLYQKGIETRFIVTKKGDTVANVPVNYLILALVLGFHLIVLTLILIFIMGYKMSIQREEGDLMDIDEAIVEVAAKVKKSTMDMAEEFSEKKRDVNASSNSGFSGSNSKGAEKRNDAEKKVENSENVENSGYSEVTIE